MFLQISAIVFIRGEEEERGAEKLRRILCASFTSSPLIETCTAFRAGAAA
jgi:hypothetical protein